ncbi:sensor histidine kinase [Aureibaculum conchae]|uniref:sensor histidine kinase n=1 Tax=Aureibaculum sp. 2308TA14-22 TaxID=3108392 RepID=UPI00339AC27D
MHKTGFTVKKIISHLLFWLLYLASEYLANLPHLDGVEHFRTLRSLVISLPIVMVPTYFMLFYAIPKLLKKNKIVVFILVCISIAIAILFARVEWLEIVNYLNSGYVGEMPMTKVVKNAIRDYAIIALAICIYIISDWRIQAKVNEQLIIAKAKSDLEILKRQLHPHFLFNTLNNIYSLSVNDSEQTSQSILKLSNLLEYLVYQSGEKEVILKDEIELMENYITLEKLRYDKSLSVEFDIDDVRNIKTPPLLLLPFIENCFKHGGKNKKGIFWITVKIKLLNSTLLITFKNSKSLKKQVPEKNSGMGLQNVKERLELLFKERYTLEIEDAVNYYEAKLLLNLNKDDI